MDTSPLFTVPADVLTGTREAAEKISQLNTGYVCPVDFDAQKKANPDIYAWITVPGTNIDYPLLRRDGNDSYYLNHDQQHNYSIAGALFTETAYNTDTFEDPVTIVYGHRMDTDTMFGMLQRVYSSDEKRRENDTIMIFTPERGYKYKIVAGVPHSDAHLLYGRDLSDDSEYMRLMNDILDTTAMGSSIDGEYQADPKDRMIILSTCYKGDITRRFLVVGYLSEIFE